MRLTGPPRGEADIRTCAWTRYCSPGQTLPLSRRHSFPSSSWAPLACERVLCLGSAEPIARDAAEGSDLDTVAGSGTLERQEDGQMQHLPA
jgi:hypothetical protein